MGRWCATTHRQGVPLAAARQGCIAVATVRRRRRQLGRGKPRAVAITKLRHIPYDSLAVTADQTDGKWRIVSILSTVDH
jgi:hypothetical protein